MKNEWEVEEEQLLQGKRRWSGETLCLKKRPTGDEKAGSMGYSKFGVILIPGFPMKIYLRGEAPADDFKTLTVINSIEEFRELGWTID